MMLTDAQWQQFDRDGYLKLGAVLNPAELREMQQEIDHIMLGQAPIDFDRLLMQLDSTSGAYNDAGAQSNGFKGPTLAYRKIQNLELDPVFWRYMQRDIFRQVCARIYTPATPIGLFRAMFMNKPARRGTELPWHQDRWTNLDRDPLLTTWTALDPATKANGCVQVIPGSHKLGLVNPSHGSGFLTDAQAREIATPDKIVYLEVAAGECMLLHNWLLHHSDTNQTDTPRRAFSVCYLDARTVDRYGGSFPVVFTADALAPQPV